jgi:TolB protein
MTRFLIAVLLCAPAALWSAPVREAPARKGEPPNTLLVVSKRAGSADIVLINNKGEEIKNLTKGTSENSYPAWSPDSKKIVFASDRDGSMNLYVMDADGGNVKQITSGAERSRSPAWSPDGKKILFGRTTEAGCGIFVVDPDGGNLKQIGNEDGWNPAWSPDGKKILFTSRRDGDGFRIYAMDADGGNTTQLTTNANPFGSVYPAYSPDGKKIIWCDGEGEGLEIHMADADGKNAKKLTQLGGYNTFPTWSADGKSIVFHHMPDYQNGPVYIMDADGGNQRELLANEELVKGARPAWKPR